MNDTINMARLLTQLREQLASAEEKGYTRQAALLKSEIKDLERQLAATWDSPWI